MLCRRFGGAQSIADPHVCCELRWRSFSLLRVRMWWKQASPCFSSTWVFLLPILLSCCAEVTGKALRQDHFHTCSSKCWTVFRELGRGVCVCVCARARACIPLVATIQTIWKFSQYKWPKSYLITSYRCCNICVIFVVCLFNMYFTLQLCKWINKWCFINTFLEEHAQIINTANSSSVITPPIQSARDRIPINNQSLH